MSDSAPSAGPLAGGPLSDVLVVDLTRALAGPQAAMMLGDLGARVIKVESATGDDTRAWGPPWAAAADEDGPRDSTYFMAANRNKESIVLNLKDPADTALLSRLVERADVLLENFRTGVLDRLGFPVERLHELNPGLVIGSISGFGHDGPEAGRAGYDQIAQGEGGLMSVTGTEAPRVVGVHAFQGTRWTIGGEVPGLSGPHHPAIAPYGLFATATSAVQVAIGSEGLWRTFATRVGLDPDEPRFATNGDRVAHREELIGVIERIFAAEPAEHWLDLLLAAGIPTGKVRSLDDVYGWEQTRSQGLLLEVDHPAYGALTLPGSPLRFDDNAFSGGREHHHAPPLLGEHGAAIREWLEE